MIYLGPCSRPLAPRWLFSLASPESWISRRTCCSVVHVSKHPRFWRCWGQVFFSKITNVSGVTLNAHHRPLASALLTSFASWAKQIISYINGHTGYEVRQAKQQSCCSWDTAPSLHSPDPYDHLSLEKRKHLCSGTGGAMNPCQSI